MSPATILVTPALLVRPWGRHCGSAPSWTLIQQTFQNLFPPPGHFLTSWLELFITPCSNAYEKKLLVDSQAVTQCRVQGPHINFSYLNLHFFFLILLPIPPVMVTVAAWHLVATTLCKSHPAKFSSLMAKYFLKTTQTYILYFLRIFTIWSKQLYRSHLKLLWSTTVKGPKLYLLLFSIPFDNAAL